MAPVAGVAAILATAGLGILLAFTAITEPESPPTIHKNPASTPSPAQLDPMDPAWVAPVPGRPWVALVRPPVASATPAVPAKVTRRTSPTQPRTTAPKKGNDPCARFKDFRREYCYQVLDDLTGG